jgi:hypothetical protein
MLHQVKVGLHHNWPTVSMDFITPLQILRFFEVLSLSEVWVGVLLKA